MGNFLKNFGLGLLFMIFSPVLVCLVAITAVFGLIYFVFMSIKCIFRFFGGRSAFKPLEIDERVENIKHHLDLSLATAEKEKANPTPVEKPVYIQQNYYSANPAAGQIPGQNPYPIPPTQPNPYTQIPQGPDIFELPDPDKVLEKKEDDK